VIANGGRDALGKVGYICLMHGFTRETIAAVRKWQLSTDNVLSTRPRSLQISGKEEAMSRPNPSQAAVVAAISICAAVGAMFATRTESRPYGADMVIDANNTSEAQIARAMSAGPVEIARSAQIVNKDPSRAC